MTDKQPLNELDRDALKTTAKAFGNRLKDAGIATLGGQKAQGRLSTRIIADKLMKAWLRYEGATDDPATPENVYNFVRRHFGGAINDADLRRTIGVPEVVKPQGPEGAKTPEGNQHISREHFNAAVKKAGGNPNNVTQEHLDQVAAEQPDLVKTAPAPTGSAPAPSATPAQPTGQEPPVTTPAPTPASTPASQSPATGTPAASGAIPAPTQPPAPNAVQTPSQAPQTTDATGGAQAPKDAAWFANASEAEQDAHWDQVAAQPAGQTPSPPQTPAATPAPTPAPSQAPQTRGLTPNGQPILRQRSAPQTEPASPPTAAPTAAPTQAPTSPGLTPNGQPILRQRSAPPTATAPALDQLSKMATQPNVNPGQIMTALGQAAKTTQPGSPQRAQLVQLIKNLQNEPSVVAKIPQLGTLSLEAYHPSGRLLTEAEAQQTPMQRSALDRVFMQLAQLMIRQGNSGTAPTGQANGSNQSASDGQASDEARPDPAKLRDQFGNRRIETDAIRRALGHDMTTRVGTQFKMVNDAMKELGNKTLLRNLLQLLDQKYRLPAARLEPAIVKALMTAVTQVQ